MSRAIFLTAFSFSAPKFKPKRPGVHKLLSALFASEVKESVTPTTRGKIAGNAKEN
jgi:hypothetical protein